MSWPDHTDHRIAAPDGLRLFCRDVHGATGARPVVCLPGLTRNHRDFEAVAARLAPARRVLCIDMRGRGRSDHDPEPANYNALIETHDIVAVLDALEIGPAVFLGTSRGGIQVMLLAVIDRTRIAGAILNDVGPRLDMAGLRRIIATHGLAPRYYPDWAAAAEAVRIAHQRQFPGVPAARWLEQARATMREEDGRPVPDHDWRILQGAQLATDEGPPELWPQFLALDGLPVLAIHGALSDILSADTLAEMQTRMPTMRAVTLQDRGHVPFLDEPDAVNAIDALLTEADRQCTPTSPPSMPPPAA